MTLNCWSCCPYLLSAVKSHRDHHALCHAGSKGREFLACSKTSLSTGLIRSVVCFCFCETRFLCVTSQGVLELSLQIRLAWNSQRYICLYLWSAGLLLFTLSLFTFVSLIDWASVLFCSCAGTPEDSSTSASLIPFLLFQNSCPHCSTLLEAQ